MAGSYFPTWRLRAGTADGKGQVIAADERLPWPQTFAMGVQHVVAMFGSTVLAPLLMGFDPNLAIFMSGIGTLLFFVLVGGRVPSYLGSSFSFIGLVIAVSAYGGHGLNPNLGVALGGIIACGVVYALIGVLVMAIGTRWIETLMPPVVTGAVVAVIGLNLAPIAVKGVSGNNFDAWMALGTVLCVGAVAVFARGMLQRLLILAGLMLAYVIYAVLTNGAGLGKPIDFAVVANAAWFGIPHFSAPVFKADAMALLAPIAIILVAENLGHIKAVEPGQIHGPRFRRRRPGDHRLRQRRRHRRHHLCGKYRRDGGHQNLFDTGVRSGGLPGDHPRFFTEVRRRDPDHSRRGAGRRIDCGVRPDRGIGRAHLGGEQGGFFR